MMAMENWYVVNPTPGVLQRESPGMAITGWVSDIRGTGRQSKEERTGGRKSKNGDTQNLSLTGAIPCIW